MRFIITTILAALAFTAAAQATISTGIELTQGERLTAKCSVGYGSLAGHTTPLFAATGERLERRDGRTRAVEGAWRYVFTGEHTAGHRAIVVASFSNQERRVKSTGPRSVFYRDDC